MIGCIFIGKYELSKNLQSNYRTRLKNMVVLSQILGGFTIIGFDQVLHYVQLFLTYYYLKQIKQI